MVSLLGAECGLLLLTEHARPGEELMRTTRTTIAFAHPVRFKGIDETFPAGSYELETDEEATEMGDRTVYRRVRTLLLVKTPGQVRTVDVRPPELDLALERDAARTRGE
jgi:hypothetical protein